MSIIQGNRRVKESRRSTNGMRTHSTKTDIDRAIDQSSMLTCTPAKPQDQAKVLRLVCSYNDIHGSATVLQALGLIPYNKPEELLGY